MLICNPLRVIRDVYTGEDSSQHIEILPFTIIMYNNPSTYSLLWISPLGFVWIVKWYGDKSILKSKSEVVLCVNIRICIIMRFINKIVETTYCPKKFYTSTIIPIKKKTNKVRQKFVQITERLAMSRAKKYNCES